ncbi:hypothetical protein JNUCC0626_48425 [Lentzea sp. JNUCC 0626]|uniref:hypothetical protein n=1 Tax=Lentzea sp. JNUCC 0626 TaxID=3367513 RepID=UPI003749C2BF
MGDQDFHLVGGVGGNSSVGNVQEIVESGLDQLGGRPSGLARSVQVQRHRVDDGFGPAVSEDLGEVLLLLLVGNGNASVSSQNLSCASALSAASRSSARPTGRASRNAALAAGPPGQRSSPR